MECFEDEINLPPGYRFHPTDEELITHYLSPKVMDCSFSTRAVGVVDFNKVEPWELPLNAKMGDKEWYFFSMRDKKYPTGMRVNRATKAGYWKATGKDKEIFNDKYLVGTKKTLVFYKGRAPTGEKTDWVMHEYRLEGDLKQNIPKDANNEWVLSRVFNKCSGGKRTNISLLTGETTCGDNLGNSNLPLLTDASTSFGESSHVSCFSKQMEDHKPPENGFDCNNIIINDPFEFNDFSMVFPQMMPIGESFQYMDLSFMKDHSIEGLLHDNDERGIKRISREEFSFDQNQDFTSSSSIVPMDMDYLWNF